MKKIEELTDSAIISVIFNCGSLFRRGTMYLAAIERSGISTEMLKLTYYLHEQDAHWVDYRRLYLDGITSTNIWRSTSISSYIFIGVGLEISID